MKRRGVVVDTIAKLNSTKPELRFCAGSNPTRGVSEIYDDQNRRSTIPQNNSSLSSSPSYFTYLALGKFIS